MRWRWFRLSIREMAGSVAIIALGLALVVQDRAARQREQAAAAERRGEWSLQAMDSTITPLGRHLLATATSAELLSIASKQRWNFNRNDIQPMGIPVPSATFHAFKEALLDRKNYNHFNHYDDFGCPAAGMRIRRGSDVLDIVWISWGRPGRSFQDVWFLLRDASGRLIHDSNTHRFHDPRLEEAIRSFVIPGDPTPAAGR